MRLVADASPEVSLEQLVYKGARWMSGMTADVGRVLVGDGQEADRRVASHHVSALGSNPAGAADRHADLPELDDPRDDQFAVCRDESRFTSR